MLIDFFSGLSPIYQALVATLFTWLVTALGAALVFFFKSINRKTLDAMLGFAAGVMIAASYWSLLAPAIEMAEGSSLPAWVPATSGFLLGGAFSGLSTSCCLTYTLDFQKRKLRGSAQTGREASCWYWPLRFTIYRKDWQSVWHLAL